MIILATENLETIMRKKMPVFSVLLVFGFVLVAEETNTELDFQEDFYGTWYYKGSRMVYTISHDRLIGRLGDEGFTVLIDTWEFIKNNGDTSDDYPKGFKITGTVEEMRGGWWINIGDSNVWYWYINTDKNSLLSYNDTMAVFIRQ
jgi:hypothetical protein